MHALAVIAAAAASWSAPQTVSAPHTFEGPLYADSGLAAWNWQDGVGQTSPTGAGLVKITNGAVSAEQSAPDGLVAARAREILSDPNRWIQGQLAMSDDARSVDPIDERAHRFAQSLRSAVRHMSYLPGSTTLPIGCRPRSSRWCTCVIRSSATAWRT